MKHNYYCRGFNKFWLKWVVQHNRRVLFWKAFLSRGGNFEILDFRRCIFLHFEVYFYFSLLFLEVSKFGGKKKWTLLSNRFPNNELFIDAIERNIILKFNHGRLALSMSLTNVRKNCYRSISFILTLEHNILITITSLVVPVSCRFQLKPCTFFLFVLKWCLLPVGLIGLCFTFCGPKGGIQSCQNVFSFTFPFCFL